MLHPVYRASRIGFALVLLPVFLGSASGAPAPGLAAPIEQPAPRQFASPRLSADSPTLVTATIPCISGTCEVQIHTPLTVAPIKPLAARTR
ncbi:MAG TPA: hypothetical protein VFT45_26830 [Longimicrobium sp.]|nr:hypothetical protein [Longimicrobium sp.]